jgi:protein transport protein SEC61 subunit alpha
MAGRFLSLFKPLARVLPEIKVPERKVGFNEKIFWTAIVLIVYLIMTEIPLYGISSNIQEQFGALRVIFASNRGTLMELGIGPIVTAGLILQLLVGSAIIQADMSDPQDRGLFTVASKFFSILLTGIQASAYIISGMYGTALPGTTTIVIFMQLLASGIIVILLDELVQKGWGLGSGISLFIMAGVAQNILWQTFNPGTGLFVGGLAQLMSGQPEYQLTQWVLGAGSYPSLLGFIATIGTFLVIIYLEGVRVELPMTYAGYKGFRSRYPIKLLYVSNLPVIFASALFANVYFFSQLLWTQMGTPAPGTNILFQVIGDYNRTSSGSVQPVGGLAYYVTPPNNILSVATEPLRASVYLAILVVFCGTGTGILLSVGIIYQYYELLMRERAAEMFPAFRRILGE